MRHIAFAIHLLVVTVALSPTIHAEGSPSDAQSIPDPESHFRELWTRAKLAFDAHNFEQARGLLLQAWSLQPTAEVALALGQSEFELKRYRDAAEHLDFAIQNLEAAQPQKPLSQAKKALAVTKTQVAVLHVTTNRDGAEIRVDGNLVGKAPLQGPLYLDPGVHDITARSSGAGITRPISLQAGQESALSLPIVTQTARAPSPWAANAPRATEKHQPVAEPQSSGPSRSYWPVIVGGAVFLTGVTTGIVFRLDSDSQFNDANALRAKLARDGCKGLAASPADCAALQTAAANGDRSRNWSTAGFMVAAGALVGTGAYWYWPRAGRKGTASFANRVRLSAVILPEASGFSISGEY